MSFIKQPNNSLLYFFIFTVISSVFAFKIVVSAYNSFDNVYNESYLLEQPLKVNKSESIRFSS